MYIAYTWRHNEGRVHFRERRIGNPYPHPHPHPHPHRLPHPCTPHLHHPHQYFAHSAKLYAAEVGVEESEANQTLASLFAFTLLSVEVVLKLFPVLLLPIATETIVIYPGSREEYSRGMYSRPA